MSVIHYYSLCWNEEVILPFTMGYYSEFCQKMVIMDNESDDRSPTIINSFANAEMRTYQSNKEIRDDIYLGIKNNIWKESRGIADWIIICDADEVLYHPNLADKLDELKAKGVTIIKPYGYDMYSENLPHESIFEIKNGVKDNRHFGKCVIFNPNQIDEINFKAGCHQCKPKGKIKFYKGDDIKLLHYKYLNLDYVLKRHEAFKKRLSEYNIKNKMGKHYLFDIQKITSIFIKNLRKAKKVLS